MFRKDGTGLDGKVNLRPLQEYVNICLESATNHLDMLAKVRDKFATNGSL